ncbi:MAG TPA: TIGR03086 family metal-binding protein [Acidimicrobiia bacterium]|nr:TIGR03086 family metal-binding protein [Acidimicrobiia bacterium]
MTENTVMLQNVIGEMSRLVAGLDQSQFQRPSPCEGWSVADVLNHVTAGAIMFAIAAEDGAVSDEKMGELLGNDNLGANPQASFGQAADRAIGAFSVPGVMDKVVKLPFGEMPASVALDIAVFDVATHACDSAYGTGQTIRDTATFEEALEYGRKMIGPELRGTGLFEAEQPPRSDAIQDRLLAFGGRKI